VNPIPSRHEGRVVFVTGAGSGIGRAIAHRLAAEGCAVACSDSRLESAHATVESITTQGGDSLALHVDVRDRPGVRAALDSTIARWGHLNYVVNNAGLVTMSSLENLTDEEWDLVLDVNLKGQFIVTQVAAPMLAMSTPSAIVNLSTVEAEVVVSSSGFAQPHYNASKGGVKMLTKACAVELAAQGTRVNAVAPGPVQTGFIPGVDPTNFEIPQVVLDRLLVKRMGQPEDIAAAVSFLLSDDASFITGTQLVVDGGWLAR
jgi:NAD(P)-dependent dehydrogenase (short-subunit alcohol dehydrogenase family)